MESQETTSSAAGIILAGGQSSRMGQNKALLRHPENEQINFVEYLTLILTPLCSEVLLVAGDAAQAASYADYARAGVRIVIDKVPNYGPLMGLYRGLSAIQATHALVIAVDMPFVQPALVSFLLHQPLSDSLLVPVVDNVPQVLLAVYPRIILPLIETCLQRGRRDPRCLLDGAPVQYIGEAQLRRIDPSLRSFVNVNTPGDLRRY